MELALNQYRPVYGIRSPDLSEDAVRRVKRIHIHRRRTAEDRARKIAAMPEHMRWERVLKRICKATGVTKKEMLSDCLERHIVFARHMAMYWLARLTKMSIAHISRRLNRDHTAVRYGCQRYRQKRAAMGRTLKSARAGL